MTARKLCTSPLHCGPRWLLSIDFHVKEWLPDKSAPRRLMSHCKTCQRVENRRYKGRWFPYQERRRQAYLERRERAFINRLARSQYRERRNSQARRRYRDKVDPRLPFGPFQSWLIARVNEDGSMATTARNVGVSWDRIRNLVRGTYKKGGRVYPVKHVRFSTVERFMHHYGDFIHLIYDFDEIESHDPKTMDSRYSQSM